MCAATAGIEEVVSRAAAAGKAGAGTLLLVDDEANVLASLRRLLRMHRFAVHVSSDPEQALAMLDEVQPDAVISDHRMPGMSGVQFLAQVRDRQPDVTRILLSGDADRQAVINAINAGAVYRYLDKPWDEQVLLATLHEAVQLTRERRDERDRQSQLRSTNEALEQALYRDSGTALATRVLLQERLQQRMQERRRGDAGLAVVVLAMGGLPAVRESYGWAAGEQLLNEAVGRVQRLVR